MGEKEALAFLKKSNKSIVQAWESYKLKIGNSENKQLNDVFKQMFHAWSLSNQKAIGLLEDKHPGHNLSNNNHRIIKQNS